MFWSLLIDQRFYKHKFEKIYWVNPTATVDPSLDVLRQYVKNDSRQNQEEDPTFHDQIDVHFLQARVDKQKKYSIFRK